jgi:hypothetical protein
MERRISVGVIGDFDPEFPPHPATPSANGFFTTAACGSWAWIRTAKKRRSGSSRTRA